MRRVLPRVLVVLVVASAISAAPSRAHADAAQARIHFEKGRTYFQVDEYRKAIDEFKAAHIERPDPAFLFNIAECYRHLGENKDALTYYRRFLVAAPANDRSRPAVDKRVAELQAKSRSAGRASSDAADVPVSPAAVTEPPPAVVVASAPAPAPAAATLVDQPSATRAQADTGEGRPFYKRAGFFVALGVVLVAGAVTVWAVSRNPTNAPGTPLGNQGTNWQ